MGKPINSIKKFFNAGMDTDSAPVYIAPEDTIFNQNVRFTGTGGSQSGYATNIESNELLPGDLLPGINNIIGGNKFDDTGQIVAFRYNTGGKNQILLYDYQTNTYKVIYTDITDSNGIALLPLNPQNIVKCVLINKTFLVWWAKDLEVGYVNLPALANGSLGTILYEDLSLLKPQCLVPPTGVYGNDEGVPANYLFGKLPQLSVQWVNADFNYATWSTWSKRIVPYQQNTPVLGSDVTKNNYIIVAANIGSERISTVNIAARFGTEIFATIKSIDRIDILALPNTAVDVANQIFEAYDPATNLYSFAYYNNDVSIPVSPTETDLFVDEIYPSNAGAVINGNILALADWKTLYDRPKTSVTVNAVGYDANIDIPADANPDPFRVLYSNTTSFKGRPRVQIVYAGTPQLSDKMLVRLTDSNDASHFFDFSLTIFGVLIGDRNASVYSFSTQFDAANWVDNGDGTTSLFFTAPEYFVLQSRSVEVNYEGATVANSIPTILDNSSYQLALEYRDKYGRPFPLETNNTFKINTPSYAQVNGQAVRLTVNINTVEAPEGAVDYQVLLTKPAISSMLDVIGTPLVFKGGWNSYDNSPTLAANDGTSNVGDTYQIIIPSWPSNTDHYTNIGEAVDHNAGDYVTYNGKSWDVIPRSFGDITDTGNIMAISLNPLNLFNTEYAEEGVETVLGYDFSVGDRCTLHYYVDGSGNKIFINNPCVNLSVFGYDSGRYIVKVEKPATFDTSVLSGKNVFLRLYSPARQVQAASVVQNGTVWYEIGQRFTITNGIHDTLAINIDDGGAYYKTRQYADAILPYENEPQQTLSVDLNYSDFYPSEFSSFGRPRTYYDVLEPTERQASIITSQPYVLGSKNNGLNRFYPANIYGDNNGQTSSSQGGIQILWQRGNTLVVIQELGTFYIPVNEAYQVLNAELTGVAISEKLLNNGRYDARGIGIGLAKESFCIRYERGFFIDPNKSIPMEIEINGIIQISGKMSQYFKDTLQAAYALGKKLYMFYDDYYEEVILCIQASGGILKFYPFSDTNWQTDNNYVIVPADVTATPNGAHCTASYNSSTGVVTYTPTTDYVGSDSATFTFNTDDGPVTVNNCLNWVAGNSDVIPFAFNALIDKPLSTLETSNIIGVFGNNIPVSISITGGEYSVNGGAWTSSTGTVDAGDSVQVRQTSSSTVNTQTNTVLTISDQSATFSVTTGTDVVDDFAFTDQTGVALSADITSNSITVSGNTIPAAISVSGGTYSINGGAFVSTPGTVNAGDTVRTKVTSSASNNALTTSFVTIDGKTRNFNVVTYYVNTFTFIAQTGKPVSTLETSNTITITGNSVAPLPISITGGSYSINGGAFTSASGTINIGDTVAVQQTSSPTADTTTTATLTIAYQSGDFDVTTQSLPPDATGILVVDMYGDTSLNVIGYVNTPGTTPYQQPAYVGNNFQPTTGTVATAQDCWVLASDALAGPTTTRRFEFNIAKLLTTYPAMTSFQFIISGRAGTTTTADGQYDLKGADAGHMIMGGTPGSYVPSTSSTVNIGTVAYSGQPIVAGADGTYGIGVGAIILTFDYDVLTKTMTLTP